MKYLLALVIGVAAGYYLGYSDGSAGKPSIVSRVVGKVGGGARTKVSNDVDATMERIESGAKADAKKSGKAP
ncbi:MAG TPA: hypothetical protein VJL28_05175 [Gemmatimonadaceae bacterium]|nr:hypothetical protein [Gemmatimonadaceae bacterium]